MADELRHTILAVDDEDGILKAMRRLLSQLDVTLITANSGAEALQKLQQQPVSLIISDQCMPGMTGIEFLQQSRKISPATIRVLLTGYADLEATIAAINSGAVRYYLTKPWDDTFLLSRIKESLNLYQMIARNRQLNEKIIKQNSELTALNKTLDRRVDEQAGKIKDQHQELVNSFMETIKAFSTIIELRQKDVGSHSQRVASVVKAMLQGADLTPKQYQDIVIAAFLHDVGKISYPDILLRKTVDDYSTTDMETVRQHPILGESCVLSITGFEEVGQIIRHHHENFDGTGYPDNLVEKRIPFGARVIRIANEFDNRTFARGYPDAARVRDVVADLFRESGVKFDPELVRRFMDIDFDTDYCNRELAGVVQLQPIDLETDMIVAEDIHTKNGLFILPKGAKLSQGMIGRLRKIHQHDPLVNGVRVFKQKKGVHDDRPKAGSLAR